VVFLTSEHTVSRMNGVFWIDEVKRSLVTGGGLAR
jgi:hypothetical protein